MGVRKPQHKPEGVERPTLMPPPPPKKLEAEIERLRLEAARLGKRALAAEAENERLRGIICSVASSETEIKHANS